MLFVGVVVVGYLILASCAIRAFPIPLLAGNCPAGAQAGTDLALGPQYEQDRRDLVDRIRGLEQRLSAMQCTPQPAVAPPPAQSTPVAPAAAPPATSNPDIDQEAWNRGDVSLLQGCWELDGEDYIVRDSVTNKITAFNVWDICFDDQGKGNETMSSPSGVTCEQRVTASFGADQTLNLADVAAVECSSGFSIYRREVACNLTSEGRAECISRQPESNATNGALVQLRRKESR